MSDKLLPEIDVDYLNSKQLKWEIHQNGGENHLVIYDFDFQEAYSPRIADLLVILPAGYPNSNPDMFWTFPHVKLANGAWPKASEHLQAYGSITWQRWSRHFPDGSWRVGVDNIRTYLAAIRREVQKGI